MIDTAQCAKSILAITHKFDTHFSTDHPTFNAHFLNHYNIKVTYCPDRLYYMISIRKSISQDFVNYYLFCIKFAEFGIFQYLILVLHMYNIEYLKPNITPKQYTLILQSSMHPLHLAHTWHYIAHCTTQTNFESHYKLCLYMSATKEARLFTSFTVSL